MARNDTGETQLSPEEAEALRRMEGSDDALARVVESLSGNARRRRQFSAHVIALLAERAPEKVIPYVPDLVDALYRPEAQTRWEVLDALSRLAADKPKAVEDAYDGAEAALFDEDSSTLRLMAFRFLTSWAATGPAPSKRAWPLLDEAIQCYHGDLEYRDMLGFLLEMAGGKIDPEVAAKLAERIRFDAEQGKGASIKARSAEIYALLAKRFDIPVPAKGKRGAAKSDAPKKKE